MQMKYKRITCKRDGLTIRGRVYGDTTRKSPVVILSHGFLANQKMCKKYAILLAKAGFVTVTFDFCGGGLGCKSDGETQKMTVLTEKEDLLAIIRRIRRLPFADKEHISLLGCSQGGFVSAMVAKQLGNAIDKLILLYPAFCIPDDARKGQMMIYKFDPQNIPDLLGKRPMKLGGDYARVVIDMDPNEEIRGYQNPVLYIHGTKDKIVDISYARKANVVYPDCQYHEIEGAGHGFRGKADQKACELILNFMKPLDEPINKKICLYSI